jgi:murein L,D-transpeptidase YcbB/YkuD
LRTRLETSGDTTDTADERALFDSGLTSAVVRFQERHGLEPDGLVGPQTLAELNVPIEERIRQIILNMERWRWFPEDLGERYILVNIAGFELTVVDGTDVVERMPVIVGQPYRRTPVFSDVIRYLEFNPFWNVPYSIATIDKLPQLQSNPGALEAIGFEAFRDGVQVPISNVQWAGFTPRNFPYTLRQRPGPENALGQVKFMFPNQFHVYLHDTPTRGLFSRSARDQPEGSRIDEILAAGKTTVVSLRTPLPVHLTYFTAWSEEDGTVQFRPDIYGRDKSLYESLFSSR